MTSNDSAMSPELDLLERLANSDLPLATAVTLFPRVDLAKKAVEICVRSQMVELLCKCDDGDVVVQPWRLRFLLNDPSTWEATDGGSSVYHLRLTPDGQNRYGAEGPRFVRELFRTHAR